MSPNEGFLSNLAHTLTLSSPDTINLTHGSEHTADHSCSSFHHSCAPTNGFELPAHICLLAEVSKNTSPW